MDKLEQLLESFRNDKENTTYANGTRRFDKEIAWIEEMIRNYAEALNMAIDEVVDIMEKGRDYWWPNYYQPCNFPPLDSKNLIGIFKNFDEFKAHSDKHWQGYRCPRCGTISPHPQECLHRHKKDGVCDWCSYGLFQSGKGVIILEDGLKAIPIFDPVPKEGV